MKSNDMKWSSQTENVPRGTRKCTKIQSTHSLLQFCTSAMVPQAAPPLAGCSKIFRLLQSVCWREDSGKSWKQHRMAFGWPQKKRAGYRKRHCKPVPGLKSNFQRITTHWDSGTQEEKPLWKSLGKEKAGIHLPQTPANVLRYSVFMLRHFATF